MIKRPRPPRSVIEWLGVPVFRPEPDLDEWARSSFISDDATLHNPDHRHLQAARIGFVWTNVPNGRHGRRIVGQCELGKPMAMGKWARARAEMQVLEWFGVEPHFMITLDAEYAEIASDAEFMALVEHELYHAGQARDAFGSPKFKKDGSPAFEMRGHDVEEFVGIVRRYGVGAAAGETLALVEAARRGPEISGVSIAQACGTCASLRNA